MSRHAPVWNHPGALATAFTIGARDSAAAAVAQLGHGEFGRPAANAKALLEEAAAQVAAAMLPPQYTLAHVEYFLREEMTLPDLIPVTPQQIRMLAGSDPLVCAQARSNLGHNATQRLLELRLRRAREEAFSDGREGEPLTIDLYLVDLFLEAQAELGWALKSSVQAEVISITTALSSEREQRGVLRLVAA